MDFSSFKEFLCNEFRTTAYMEELNPFSQGNIHDVIDLVCKPKERRLTNLLAQPIYF